MQALRGVDAHAHVFHRGLNLAPGRRYDPVADAPLPDWLELLDRLGLVNGVLVQPSFLGTDNSFMLGCIANSQRRLRGVAVVPQDIPAERLAALKAGGIVAVRFNLIGVPIPDFSRPPWCGHLQRITDAGLHVEVQCRGHEVPSVLSPLLDVLPRVVLDHYGLPANADPAAREVRRIIEFSVTHRVYVKLSASYRFLPPSTDLVPLLMAYADTFGPERLLWGSDWPHTQFEGQGDPAGALEQIGSVFGTGTLVYQAITGATAQNLYGFDNPASCQVSAIDARW